MEIATQQTKQDWEGAKSLFLTMMLSDTALWIRLILIVRTASWQHSGENHY